MLVMVSEDLSIWEVLTRVGWSCDSMKDEFSERALLAVSVVWG